jgi:hypothetical protein
MRHRKSSQGNVPAGGIDPPSGIQQVAALRQRTDFGTDIIHWNGIRLRPLTDHLNR